MRDTFFRPMERDGVPSGSTEASWLDQLFGAAICTTPCHPYAQNNNNNSALPSPTGLEPSAANGGLPTCTSQKMGPGARVSQVSAVQSLWGDAGNFFEPESEDEEMHVA